MPSEDSFDPDVTITSVSGPVETAGTMIGRYRLIEKIGEGGMGEVWLAEQKEPVRRRVALKLVKAGMNTHEVIARFESERQALALMDHPAIAKVFDAGTTPQGAPYFVMEYVAGILITEYCDHHKLNTRERLELFLHVCEGVQHAHQKAIIHRDLKPSNILVTEVDGKPAPKIIDFGVAKALTQKLTAHTMFTRVGTLIGTPEYMSPEQAISSGEDVDTRTDVYSLGVIFYELLAGAPPIELRRVAYDEFLRRLRQDDPPKPSTKIRTQAGDTSTAVARQRQTEPQLLAKQIQGELDSIALKALEKDRGRRYGSPSDFGADIGRYLRNEPVLAVPPSIGYRAGKFGRRYRAPLATAAAFALVLIAATAVSILQSIRANREAVRARRAEASAQAVNNFLQNDLLAQASSYSQSGPGTRPDPDLKVRTALDRAAASIEGKFDKQPEVEAGIRFTIGRTYIDLGQYPEARKQLERAVALYRQSLGAEDPKTLLAETRLASVADLQGKYVEAQSILTPTLEIQRRVLGPDHPETLTSMTILANVYTDQGKYAQAEPLCSQILDARRRVLGPEHPDTLKSMNNLAAIYDRERKYAQSEALFSELVEIRRRVLGPEHPDTLLAEGNLAAVYSHEGKNYGQAQELDDQVLAIQQRALGPDHPDTLRTMTTLARVYTNQGKFKQAETVNNQIVEIRRRLLGPDHPDTLMSMNNLAGDYAEEGKYAQAETIFREVLEIQRRVLPPTHPDTFISMNNVAEAECSNPDLRQHCSGEALQLARAAVEGLPNEGGTYQTLGMAAYRNDRWDEAIAALNRSAELDRGTDPTDFFFLTMAHWRRGEKDEAAHFFQQGVALANKGTATREQRMFWAEAAKLVGKPGPPNS